MRRENILVASPQILTASRTDQEDFCYANTNANTYAHGDPATHAKADRNAAADSATYPHADAVGTTFTLIR